MVLSVNERGFGNKTLISVLLQTHLTYSEQRCECPRLLRSHLPVSWTFAVQLSQRAPLHQQPESGALWGQGRRALWESVHTHHPCAPRESCRVHRRTCQAQGAHSLPAWAVSFNINTAHEAAHCKPPFTHRHAEILSPQNVSAARLQKPPPPPAVTKTWMESWHHVTNVWNHRTWQINVSLPGRRLLTSDCEWLETQSEVKEGEREKMNESDGDQGSALRALGWQTGSWAY